MRRLQRRLLLLRVGQRLLPRSMLLQLQGQHLLLRQGALLYRQRRRSSLTSTQIHTPVKYWNILYIPEFKASCLSVKSRNSS